MSRLDDRLLISNSLDMYKNMLEERGVPFITHYGTPMLQYPTVDDITELELAEHRWKRGDKLFKIAYEHYGDSKLWYVIAWFNKKPTEAHYKNGDLVIIPKPVTRVINMLSSR